MTKQTNTVNLGKLFITATPIGNLKDITLRALDVLKFVDIIACEDTRVTQKLLMSYNLPKKPLISYGKHNLKNVTPKLLNKLLEGQNIALVSDAGTPLVSDPGAELVALCHNKGIKVVTIPGASSVISAVSLAAHNKPDFFFGGFLPNTATEISNKIKGLLQLNALLVFFTTSNKLNTALSVIIELFGPTQPLIIARELTKIFEETLIYTAQDLQNMLQNKPLKGEIVLLIPNCPANISPDIAEQLNLLKLLLPTLPLKEALKVVEKFFKNKNIIVNKKELYNLYSNSKI